MTGKRWGTEEGSVGEKQSNDGSMVPFPVCDLHRGCIASPSPPITFQECRVFPLEMAWRKHLDGGAKSRGDGGEGVCPVAPPSDGRHSTAPRYLLRSVADLPSRSRDFGHSLPDFLSSAFHDSSLSATVSFSAAGPRL